MRTFLIALPWLVFGLLPLLSLRRRRRSAAPFGPGFRVLGHLSRSRRRWRQLRRSGKALARGSVGLWRW